MDHNALANVIDWSGCHIFLELNQIFIIFRIIQNIKTNDLHISITIPHICHFFTQAKFLENQIYTEKRQFLPIFRQFLPIYTEICTEKRQFLTIFAKFLREI